MNLLPARSSDAWLGALPEKSVLKPTSAVSAFTPQVQCRRGRPALKWFKPVRF